MDGNGEDGVRDFRGDIEALSEHESGIRLDAESLTEDFENKTILLVLLDIFREMKDWKGVETYLNLPDQFFIKLFTLKPQYRTTFYKALQERIQECAIEVLPSVISELMGIFQEPDIDAKTRLQAATQIISIASKKDSNAKNDGDDDALSLLYKKVSGERGKKK